MKPCLTYIILILRWYNMMYHLHLHFLLFQVGLYDGGVAVYNVRQTADDPILDNL